MGMYADWYVKGLIEDREKRSKLTQERDELQAELESANAHAADFAADSKRFQQERDEALARAEKYRGKALRWCCLFWDERGCDSSCTKPGEYCPKVIKAVDDE